MVVAGAVAAAAAYGEFILDIRTPRASLIELHAITSSVSILMADYYQAIETMKKKYGVDAETALETLRPDRPPVAAEDEHLRGVEPDSVEAVSCLAISLVRIPRQTQSPMLPV